jgi:CHAT domain-containing protein
MIRLLESTSPSIESVLSESQQRNELEKMDLLLHITHQLGVVQVALEAGQVNEATISELHDVLLVSRVLLQMGAPQLPLYQLEEVRLCRAETFRTIAQSYEALQESEKAIAYGEKASRLTAILGQNYRTLRDQGICEESRDFLCWENAPMADRLFQTLIGTAIETAYRLQQWDFMLRWVDLTRRSAIDPTQSGITARGLADALQQMGDTFQQKTTVDEPISPSLLPQEQLRWFQFIHKKRLPHHRHCQSFELRAVQAQLADDEGILDYYWVSPHQLLMTTMDHQQIFCRIQPISPADHQLLHGIHQSVVQGQQTIAPEQLQQLSLLLLPGQSHNPVAAQQRSLLQQKRRLLISMPENLDSIPFQILPWEGGYLIQRFALTHIPNLSSLLIVHGEDGGNRLKPMLVLEVQELTIQQTPTPAPQDWLSRLGGQAVTKLNATENTATVSTLDFLADIGALEQYRYLHFTTHGDGGASAVNAHLQLQDSCLDSLKIANWQLNAELVVLAMTAPKSHGHSSGKQACLGLRSAFFAAGTKRVISAHSALPEVSNVILTNFHTYLEKGDCMEIALQKASQDSLAVAQQRGAGQNVYQWAPFSLSAFGRTA